MPLMKNEVFLRIAGPLLVGLMVVTVWELACRLWSVPVYIFPKPTDVAASLVDQAPVLFAALWTTLRITLIAFLCAVVAGVLLAVLFVQSRFLEISLFPYAVLLQVTPIAAISPLIIILVKNTEAALILCASIVALFPIISNTTLGLKSVDQGLENLFRVNRASKWQTLTRLKIPAALPYVFGGFRISIGLALIGAVVGEFVAGTGGSGAGLAYQIMLAGFQLDIPLMFAALLLITVTGVLLFITMVGVSRLVLGSWHESAR
ncbi:ABC transporter ATP-binding protein [Haematobacter massiliensis]|uniref:ABC transporter ATP-binding protein n=1 Tax=Haematobacter massiliensis TaxID=195105 RepID=A0A086Y4V1_9RHOB|nr:ABC transporter permease [Haematobacter massiliensis]KFI29301.1 ABC transporter ATP-binding protein [Haematobacter massiliensis]